MHPYYQQNEERLKRQMNAYLILVRLEIEQIFGKAYDEAFEEIWGYYRAQMLERCPYIGGDRSSGTKNLTGCLFFIAVGVCGKNHGLSTHESQQALSDQRFLPALWLYGVSAVYVQP